MSNYQAFTFGDQTLCGDLQSTYVEKSSNSAISYVSINEVAGEPYFMLDVGDPNVMSMTGDT